MPDKTWKKSERRAAAAIGSVRNPLSGGNGRHSRSDSLHSEIFLENKYNKGKAMFSLYDETLPKARQENKIPLLAVHAKNRKGFLFVIHSDDLPQLVEVLHAQQQPRKPKIARRKNPSPKVAQPRN